MNTINTRQKPSPLFVPYVILFLVLVSCFKVERLSETPQGGDFIVQTQNGSYSSLNQRNKVIFLFFGFLRCPQVCPHVFKELKKFVELLSPDDRKNVSILFITIDKRDSWEDLKNRIQSFPEVFNVAKPTTQELSKVMSQFGAIVKEYPGTDPADIAFDHTSSIFVINQKGFWVETMPYQSNANQILQSYLSAKDKKPIYLNRRTPRKIITLGSFPKCDLSIKKCKLDNFEMEITPRPITPEKEYQIIVRGSSDKGVPFEVDINGLDINMGLIRPKLELISPNTYQGKFYIPLCETPQMKWQAQLRLKSDNFYNALNFYFNTLPLSQR
jgi:cytochrome oxidase Cu insertion factor (SCO1/SenC/PrrC family)